MNHKGNSRFRLWVWIVLLTGQAFPSLGQARMTQDGSVVRLSNPFIAATFNLSSGEWEILRPDGQLLFSGLPSPKKETPDPNPHRPRQFASVQNPGTGAQGMLRSGRDSVLQTTAKTVPKPESTPTKKALKVRTQTFALARSQTCQDPVCALRLKRNHVLRIAVPDAGSWSSSSRDLPLNRRWC